MDLPVLHKKFMESKGICTDTRKLGEGNIYFALRGPNFNGNLFAVQALENGAMLAVVDEDLGAKDDRIIQVGSVLGTLQDLAAYHRMQFNIPVIGITGSNGKTTNKELIYAVLSQKYSTLCTKGNLNNHIGVPLTLLNLTKEHEIAVIEMGANHVSEIRDLCAISRPGYGLITSIGIAHLEGFGSLEGIIQGKGELFAHILKEGGWCFVNERLDHIPEIFERLSGASEVPGEGQAIRFGDPEHPPFVEAVEQSPALNATFNLGNTTSVVHSNLIGAFQADNLLHAIAVGQYFGVEMEDIITALEAYVPSNNRAELKDYKGNSVILDAYNANPPSMKAAIQAFLLKPGRPKMAILGDMFELGSSSTAFHQEIVDLVNTEEIDEVILIGKDFSRTQIPKRMYHFDTTAEAREWWQDQQVGGYDILIKGSRGVHLEVLLED